MRPRCGRAGAGDRPGRPYRRIDVPAARRRHRSAAGRAGTCGARLPRGGARDARRDSCAAGSRSRRLRACEDGDRSGGSALERTRPFGGASETADRGLVGQRPPARDSTFQGPGTTSRPSSSACSPMPRIRARHSPTPSSSSTTCSRTSPTRSRRSSWSPRSRSLIRISPKRSFAVALAALNTGLKDIGHFGRRRPGGRSGARAQAGMGTRRRCSRPRFSASDSPAEAIGYLQSFLKAQPESRAAAGALAQLYVEQKRYAEARAIFEQFWEAGQGESRLSSSASPRSSVQMKDWAMAESLLAGFEASELRRERRRRALSRAGRRRNGPVCARLSSAISQCPRASGHGPRSCGSRRCWRKQGKRRRRAQVSRRSARRDDRAARPGAPGRGAAPARRRRQRWRVCGARPRRSKNIPTTRSFSTTRRWSPRSSTSSMSSKLACKRLIAVSPDNAQALNALGYTLVDRTTRTSEGLALIEQALKLSPDDPFILDSMGWALFPDGQVRRRRNVPAPRACRAGATPKSPRTWARCSGRRASAYERRKCGSRN